MNSIFSIIAIITGLVFPAALAAEEPSDSEKIATEIVSRTIEQYIRPGYANFAEITTFMVAINENLCANPTAASLDIARAAFRQTVLAWSGIEFVRFGPVRDENRLEKIVFFPDRRGIALRQIQALIASEDAAALVPGAMEQKSAGVQGLVSLEFVLFGTGSDGIAEGNPHQYRCNLGTAIARNVAAMAADIEQEWLDPEGISHNMLNPGEDNPLFQNNLEALTVVLKILRLGYEIVADARIYSILGGDSGVAKPRRSIWRRSGQTRASFLANIEGLRMFANASGTLEHLPEEIATAAQNQFAFENDNILAALHALDAPIPVLVETDEGYDKVSHTLVLIDNLREFSLTTIMGGYGLSAGFSELDGD